MLRQRDIEDGQTLRGHLVCGIQRTIASLCPEDSWGPDVGSVGVRIEGYDPKTIKNASTVRLDMPSGEAFIITVEQAIP